MDNTLINIGVNSPERVGAGTVAARADGRGFAAVRTAALETSMHRIDSSGNVAGSWSNGTPPLTPGTAMDAAWFNAVQEELINVINALAGITLVKGTNTQLGDALYNLFGRLAATTNTWTGDQDIAGDVSIDPGNLNVNTGGLFVAGNTLMDGQLSVGSIFGATGAATFGSTVGITGAVTASSTLAVTGLTRLTGGVENATAATASVPQTALELTNGHLKLSGVAPNSDEGLANALTPLNVCKAWAIVSTDSLGGASIVDGYNVTSVAISGNDVVVTLATPFASTTYLASGDEPGTPHSVFPNGKTTTTTTFRSYNHATSSPVNLGATATTLQLEWMGRQ